jgi:ABC-type branched-subunit amino acid transport system substrate-binding protein
VQPKTRQIAPVEFDWIQRTWAPRHVAILAGQSTFLAGQADRLQAALSGAGVAVTRIPITAGQDDYAAEVGQALASGADAVYVSTKIAEGVKIATLLAASASRPRCFLGFANQDPSFVEKAGIAVSRTCVFSGVPAPTVFPTAKAYVRDYRRAFGIEPATWGVFTYDSARLLFQGMRQAGTVNYAAVMKRLRRTVNFRGATGTITIDPVSGDRRKVAVAVLTVDDAGRFVLAPG